MMYLDQKPQQRCVCLLKSISWRYVFFSGMFNVFKNVKEGKSCHSVEPRLQGLMGNESVPLPVSSPPSERVRAAVLHPAPVNQSA